MSTMIIERRPSLFFTSKARVLRDTNDVPEDMAASIPSWSLEKANPYITWIAGNYVESDNPNDNGQFWTADDLELGEYSIKYSPLNINHSIRRPVGFHLATRRAFKPSEDATRKPFVIQVLAGLWSHLFPAEDGVVRQADEEGRLHLSMECVAEKVTCAGEKGCGETFDYFAVDDHCAHLKERTSVRHLVNPTFRGGACIVPPLQPGWAEATAEVYQAAVMEAASQYAAALNDAGRSRSPEVARWEEAMSGLVALA